MLIAAYNYYADRFMFISQTVLLKSTATLSGIETMNFNELKLSREVTCSSGKY